VRKEADVSMLGKAVKVLEDDVQASDRHAPSLLLSLALTLAARDLAVELGNLSIVTPNKKHDYSSKEDQLCYKKVKRYVKESDISGQLGDLVLYSTDEPLSALAKMLVSPTMRDQYLWSPSFSVCGIAHSFHNALDHCVVVIFAKEVKENPTTLLKMMRSAETPERVEQVASRFIPEGKPGASSINVKSHGFNVCRRMRTKASRR